MKGQPWREGSLPREYFENREKIDPEVLRPSRDNATFSQDVRCRDPFQRI
jgi:hypothetical protein